jgi:hypothetical protein
VEEEIECSVLQLMGETPSISLHTVTGVRARSYQTMNVFVTIGDAIAITLLDSGSTHNFIDVDMVRRADVPIRPSGGLSVAVANGDRIASPGKAIAQSVHIGGEAFNIDLYALPLGDYDMVLGVQWLRMLGPILWDFARHTLAFSRHGKHVVWRSVDATPGPATTALQDSNGDLLDVLLEEFTSVFQEPQGLPPRRRLSHRIRLKPGTSAVAARSYRYTHLQKDKLEHQCDEMLRTGIIRQSTPTFSSPALLIRKSDGLWRFCMDYRALNAATIKDKFPIPVVQELLDELRGAKFFTKLDLRSGYHQVLMHPDDVHMTTFLTHQGLFEFLVMPFGLTNAPATFQALMNDVLHPFLCRFVLVFLMTSSSIARHGRTTSITC